MEKAPIAILDKLMKERRLNSSMSIPNKKTDSGHAYLTVIMLLIKTDTICAVWNQPRTDLYRCMMAARKLLEMPISLSL